jgi:hypothetical protein
MGMKASELLLLALLAAVSGCTGGQGNQPLNEVPLRNATAADASAVPAMTNEWLTLKTLGVRVELSAEWQAVKETTNFFVQKRARHAQHGIEMSAGAFGMDISVEHYAGVVAASLTTNALEQLDHVAKRVHSDRSDLERILSKTVGRGRLAESIRQLEGFELIDVSFQDVIGGRQYDVRSKTTGKSGRTLYRRDFVLAGLALREIVQITYVGPSEEVFTNRAIISSVRKEIVR